MARKGSSIHVLQFGRSFISLLKVKPDLPQLRVLASSVQRGEWGASDATLGEALSTFADANELAGERLFTVLPRHEATIRVLELPSQSDDEIEGMVRLSAEEIVPFPVEELVTGHCILERLAQGSSRVLAVVVHRDVIDAHLQVLKSAGLIPEQILLSTDCLMAAARESNAQGSEAFVHLSPGGIEILMLDDGRFAYGRGIATEHLWDESEFGEGAGDELASEVRASLTTHRRDSGAAGGTETVFLSSSCVDVQKIAEKLGDVLDLPCREASRVFENVGVGMEQVRFTPAVALGAALIAQQPGEHRVGLMPQTELRRRESASSRLQLIRIAAMLVVAAVSLAGVYWQAVAQRSAYIEELDVRAEALRPLAHSVETKRQHLRMLQRQVERESTVMELFAAISRSAPENGLNFTRFDYERNRGITLYGRALERL